jgi:hypothetical protein
MHAEPQMKHEVFEKSDKKMLDEILRQAELFLQAQLTIALASDQRSLVFSSVIAGLVTILIGGGISILTQNPHSEFVIIPFIPMLLFLIVAMIIGLFSSRPIKFRVVGNNPKQWVDDINEGKSLHTAKAETAALYWRAIEENHQSLATNARLLRFALRWTFAGVLAGFLGLLTMLPS